MRIFGIPLIDTSLIKVGQRDVIRDLSDERSGVTVRLFAEKLRSASLFPCDTARAARTTLPRVQYFS